MPEDKDLQQQNEQSQNVDPAAVNYIETINKLKSNTVDKATYDKLLAENKQLLDVVVNGQPQQEQPEVIPTEDDINKLRENLFGQDKDLSNLDYVKKALELRSALLKSGQPDCFIPIGHQISPTREDIEIANKIAQVYQDCIDYAEGDSILFTQELMRRTNDVRIR